MRAQEGIRSWRYQGGCAGEAEKKRALPTDNLKKMRQQTDQRLKQQAAQKEQRQETEKKNQNDDDKA